MRPFAKRRLEGWWHSLVSALLVLAVIAVGFGLVLLAGAFGRRAILPILGAGSLLIAVTAQSNRARIVFAAIGGALIRG